MIGSSAVRGRGREKMAWRIAAKWGRKHTQTFFSAIRIAAIVTFRLWSMRPKPRRRPFAQS